MQSKVSIQEEQVGGVVLLHQARPSGSPASPAQWTSCNQCGCNVAAVVVVLVFSEFDLVMVNGHSSVSSPSCAQVVGAISACASIL